MNINRNINTNIKFVFKISAAWLALNRNFLFVFMFSFMIVIHKLLCLHQVLILKLHTESQDKTQNLYSVVLQYMRIEINC